MSSCLLLFSKGTIFNLPALSPVPFICIYHFMMWTFVCVNTDLHSVSHIVLVYINELCVKPAIISTSVTFGVVGVITMYIIYLISLFIHLVGLLLSVLCLMDIRVTANIC